MQFTKTSAIVAAVAGLSSAAPTGMKARQTLIPFRLTGTYMYADFLHTQNITASGLGLQVGGDTATFCPGADVPCGNYPNQTVFTAAAGSDQGVALDTDVPGGQGLYIGDDGQVVYNEAHSHSLPPGALQAVWTYTPGDSSTVGSLTGGANFNFVFACPTTPDENAPFLTPWPLFANVPGFKPPTGSTSDCVSVTLDTIEWTGGAGAWQYS